MAQLTVEVDLKLCSGHGRCYSLCPEIFGEDAAGYALLKRSDIPKDLESKVRHAAENCPERAIALKANESTP